MNYPDALELQKALARIVGSVGNADASVVAGLADALTATAEPAIASAYLALANQPVEPSKLAVGGVNVAFKKALSRSGTDMEVLIGADVASTRANLVAALNGRGGPGYWEPPAFGLPALTASLAPDAVRLATASGRGGAPDPTAAPVSLATVGIDSPDGFSTLSTQGVALGQPAVAFGAFLITETMGGKKLVVDVSFKPSLAVALTVSSGKAEFAAVEVVGQSLVLDMSTQPNIVPQLNSMVVWLAVGSR